MNITTFGGVVSVSWTPTRIWYQHISDTIWSFGYV